MIIIDGLDQLPSESDGRRDISFLPSVVPSGIVLVIGTRPDDTLVELSQKPQSTVYEIPHLSRSDFEFILKQKKLELDSSLIQRLYVTLQQNALYLDLAVRELIAQPALEAEDLLHRVADNPDNLFSFTIDRLSLGSNQSRWERVTQPILGLLLVASAPLSELALRELLQVAPRELRQSLQQLGGLLSQTSDARFSLFHRKFHDYLREDADNPAKDFVFTSTDEHRYHLRLVDWCANGAQGLQSIWNQAPADALEQERRTFARQYYVPHLAAAGNYAQLWKLIDDDEYGSAKRRYDRSLRAYLRDLDVDRRSFQDAHKGNAEAQALALPHIWRYNVVYRLMNSYSPHYSSTYLCALSAVGSIAEALSLANRVTEPSAKLRVLCAMSRTVLGINDNDARIIALEAYQSIGTLGTEPEDIEAAMLLAQVLFDCHSDNESEQIIHYVTKSLITLTGRSVRVQVSLKFAQLLYHTGRMEESERLHEEIGRLAHADNNDAERSALINSLVVCRNIAYAIDVWKQIRSTQHRIQASKAISRYCQLIGDTTTLALIMSELQILAAQSADLDLAVALHLAGDMIGAERIFAAKQNRIDERWSWGRRDLGSNISDDNFEYWYGDDPHFTEPRDREVDSLLIGYIPALIETEQWDRAYAHAKRMTDDTKLNQALRSLAAALIDAGQWGFARRIIAAIASQNERTALRATLAIAFAHTQQWQEAQRTIAELPHDDVRLSPGCTLIIALARAGQLSEAGQLSTHYRNKAQGLVLQSYLPKATRTFEVLARSLDGDRVDEVKTILMTAKRSAEMIADPLQRATVLLRLGTMFFEIQETGTAQTCFADAADTSRSLNDPVARATFLRSLARAVAEAQFDHTDTMFCRRKKRLKRSAIMRFGYRHCYSLVKQWLPV
ncbi:MAG: hypothetical protein HC828_13625, partial [Blastochloris sp.]|nr:hypothetical protein [Blastochloris sp.]